MKCKHTINLTFDNRSDAWQQIWLIEKYITGFGFKKVPK